MLWGKTSFSYYITRVWLVIDQHSSLTLALKASGTFRSHRMVTPPTCTHGRTWILSHKNFIFHCTTYLLIIVYTLRRPCRNHRQLFTIEQSPLQVSSSHLYVMFVYFASRLPNCQLSSQCFVLFLVVFSITKKLTLCAHSLIILYGASFTYSLFCFRCIYWICSEAWF